MADTHQVGVEPEGLRALVRSKYQIVATDPGAGFHFHTGRVLADKLGYDRAIVDSLPDRAVESFDRYPRFLADIAGGRRQRGTHTNQSGTGPSHSCIAETAC
jgi:hypothetical protein